MSLDRIVDSGSSFKKKILVSAAAVLASLFATQAQAQDSFDSPATKRPVEKTKEEERKAEPQKDTLSGYLTGEASTSPREDAFTGKGKFTLNPGNDWRISAYAFTELHLYDNDENEDLEARSNEIDFAIGKYLQKSKKFDLYAELRVGHGTIELNKAIDLDADYFTYGGKLGVASRENGTRFELGIYNSKGDADYTLLSGFEGKGDFDRFFAGAELTQRLLGSGKKSDATRGEFDVRDLGDEFEESLHLSLKGVYSKDKYADIQEVESKGFEIALPYVMNFREIAHDSKGNLLVQGHMWQFRPYFQWGDSNSESERSVRTTDSDRSKIGFDVTFKPNTWLAVKAGIGYEWYRLDIDDPVRGNDRKDYSGLTGLLSLNIDW